MHKLLLYLIAILVAIFLFLPCVEAFNLYDYFPNLVPGQDPGQPDTLYVVCQNQTASSQVLQVRVKTDNVSTGDSIQGFSVVLRMTVDQPGVTLDTTTATTYAGTALSNWEFLSSDVYPPNSDPSVFPMYLTLGGVDFDAQNMLAAGDYLLANLVFSLSRSTNICVDTTSVANIFDPSDTLTTVLVTGGSFSNVIEYVPQWRPACCGPVVPTLSQWGLIVFSLLLLTSLIFYLRRRTSTI